MKTTIGQTRSIRQLNDKFAKLNKIINMTSYTFNLAYFLCFLQFGACNGGQFHHTVDETV